MTVNTAAAIPSGTHPPSTTFTTFAGEERQLEAAEDDRHQDELPGGPVPLHPGQDDQHAGRGQEGPRDGDPVGAAGRAEAWKVNAGPGRRRKAPS